MYQTPELEVVGNITAVVLGPIGSGPEDTKELGEGCLVNLD